jgi:hypothetical protein
MKLIWNFGLAALLVAFLAVPSLAEKHHGGGVKDSHDSYAPSPAPKVKQPKTQTGSQALPPSGVKGESTQPLPSGAAKKSSDIYITPRPTTPGGGFGAGRPATPSPDSGGGFGAGRPATPSPDSGGGFGAGRPATPSPDSGGGSGAGRP